MTIDSLSRQPVEDLVGGWTEESHQTNNCAMDVRYSDCVLWTCACHRLYSSWVWSTLIRWRKCGNRTKMLCFNYSSNNCPDLVSRMDQSTDTNKNNYFKCQHRRDSVMVGALDLQSTAQGFESRPFHFHVTTLDKLFTHTCLSHLVLVKRRWCSMAGKVTVGLTSHWPCVTDSVVYAPTGSMAYDGEISSKHPRLWSSLDYGTFTSRGHSGAVSRMQYHLQWATYAFRSTLVLASFSYEKNIFGF